MGGFTNLSQVPEVVVLRLPLYVRALTGLVNDGNNVINSHQLGRRLQMTPAQIRKDLSYFGKFGKQGRGYDTQFLLEELRQILGLDRNWSACLVGVGRLGRAIINYPGFAPEGFAIAGVFDKDPNQIGTFLGGLEVQPMSELNETVTETGATIGIVAVPSTQAQAVTDQLVNSGLKGILNYAPIVPQVPSETILMNIDPVLSLQSMTFYLRQLT